MEKQFELCLILGRFNHFHNGHKILVDLARKVSEKTIILIGSATESGTIRNPYKYEMRKKLIEEMYGEFDDVIIAPLSDLTNENDISFEWGDYLLENATKVTGKRPDSMIYGKDESRKGWFRDNAVSDITEIIVSREKFKISATDLRKLLVKDDFEKWKQFVPEKLHKYYEELKVGLKNQKYNDI